MRKATKKELKTIKEVFRMKYVKVLFEKLYFDELIIKKEYELSMRKCDEEINKILENRGLNWKKEKVNKLSEIGASEYPIYLISNNKPYRVNVGYPLKESQIKEYLNELNKYHATNFYIHPTFNHTINDIPDKITFDLEPNEKIFRLIPIIKDIDNPENVLNKFKLGIVTTLVDTISTIYMDIKKSTIGC